MVRSFLVLFGSVLDLLPLPVTNRYYSKFCPGRQELMKFSIQFQ